MTGTLHIAEHPLVLIIVFVWVGFVCAISFMESWLKFRAPGVNLPLGLGIGRIVFKALNIVEWVMAITIIATYIVCSRFTVDPRFVLFIIILTVLMLQTFYLLPKLDQRAEMHIVGKSVPRSNLHFYYVAAEVVKVVCLVIFGLAHIKSK
jgi:hypothetical protein